MFILSKLLYRHHSFHSMRLLRRVLRPIKRNFDARPQIRTIVDARPFQEGDLVVLRQKRDKTAQPILTRPLKPGLRIENHNGILQHDEIIAKRPRDVVRMLSPRSGKPAIEYRAYEVRMDEYITMSRRLVTPIYPADANLIVSLFDLHPQPPPQNGVLEADALKLEILEAGTGHGGLTLHLSKAIHAANLPMTELDSADEESRSRWKNKRAAVLHSIDASAKFSAHAQHVVSGFRRGMYSNNVDFHVGDVGTWVARTLREREGQPFLSHAFLDLPSADKQLEVVASALRVDGTLIVFNPSITQIMECAKKVREEGIDLELERVIELGVNGGTGGREWDVRPVKPRVLQRLQQESESHSDEGPTFPSESSGEVADQVHTPSTVQESSETLRDSGWSIVCRPKVGERITGGGFLGIWKKQRAATVSSDP